jgi:phasin family protein
MAEKATNAAGETPFATAISQAKTATDGFTKMLGEMKLPAVPDMGGLLAAQKRNMEAMAAANRIALEGAQTVARRHMEIVQQSMSDLTEAMRAMATAEPPQAKAAHQAELVKRSYERAVANTKELSDLIQRSNSEAIGLLNKRFAEAMQEVTDVIGKAMPKA